MLRRGASCLIHQPFHAQNSLDRPPRIHCKGKRKKRKEKALIYISGENCCIYSELPSRLQLQELSDGQLLTPVLPVGEFLHNLMTFK